MLEVDINKNIFVGNSFIWHHRFQLTENTNLYNLYYVGVKKST